MMMRTPIIEIQQKLNVSRRRTLQLISQIDEQIASYRPRPDAWSVKDHVAHLVAVEESVIHFAHRILNEDCPISSLCYEIAFDQDAWNNREVAKRSTYSWLQITQSLDETRQELLALLDHISAGFLTRVGSHPIWGSPVTLASVLRVPYRHERAHRDEIAVLCALHQPTTS
jgi:uncharacterized damage-inducible protein DinB